MSRIFFTVLLAGVAQLCANDTSLHDGRFGPEPLEGGESPVRMVREHIEVGFGYRDTDVHCTFVFRNTLKDRPVEQLVGFPDIGAAMDEIARREPRYADSIRDAVNTSTLRRMRTRVNGHAVRSELKMGEARPGHDPDGSAVWSFDGKRGVRAWHTVRVTFPVGKDVIIERFYTVDNGSSVLGVRFFQYTTATGGVWHGRIGRLQADVTLRDRLTADRLIWPGMKPAADLIKGEDAKYATTPGQKSWQVLDPKHLRLVWTDFEPRTEKNHRGFSLSRRR